MAAYQIYLIPREKKKKFTPFPFRKGEQIKLSDES